jgi:uncharacterized protein
MADVMKVWAWALGSLLLALWLTPIAYNGGKALAELSPAKDFNAFLDKVAAWGGAASLGDFFKIFWVLTALLLLLPLVEWLRLGVDREKGVPWTMRLPHGVSPGVSVGQPIRPNRWGLLQGLTGFFLTFGCFVLIGWTMIRAGAFGWAENAGEWREGLWLEIGLAFFAALVIEGFFRCAVLGVFLRGMGVGMAIGMAALMFAGTHFIVSGFENARGVDGETLTALGLAALVIGPVELLPRLLVFFMPWFAFGCLLGWARWRTASLWLPGGLLMGWILADRLFSKATVVLPSEGGRMDYLVAGSIQNGLVPFLGVITVGGLVYIITLGYALNRNAED